MSKKHFFLQRLSNFLIIYMVKYGCDFRKEWFKMFKNMKNSLLVSLSGELDQYAAADLKSKIDIEIQIAQKKNLIIDLSRVSLMDSSGIGLIVGRYKIIHSLGGKLAICGANEYVEKMIALSGIKKIIPSYKNAEEADRKIYELYKNERNENK